MRLIHYATFAIIGIATAYIICVLIGVDIPNRNWYTCVVDAAVVWFLVGKLEASWKQIK